MTKQRYTFLSRLSRFRTDEGGIAAVQFAFIAPLFGLIFLGAAASFQSARAARQATTTTVTVADLVTRSNEMDKDRREAVYATSKALMDRWPEDNPYAVSITSIVNPEESAGDPEVDKEVVWSVANRVGYRVETDDLGEYKLPDIAEGDSVILVHLQGAFLPDFVGFGFPTPINIDRQAVRRPRFVSEVPYEEEDGTIISSITGETLGDEVDYVDDTLPNPPDLPEPADDTACNAIQRLFGLCSRDDDD